MVWGLFLIGAQRDLSGQITHQLTQPVKRLLGHAVTKGIDSAAPRPEFVRTNSACADLLGSAGMGVGMRIVTGVSPAMRQGRTADAPVTRRLSAASVPMAGPAAPGRGGLASQEPRA